MRKLIIKGVVFLIMLSIPLLYLNFRYKNTNYYLQINGLGKFHHIEKGIEILNLGNSHEAAGIIYESNVDRKGYNLALDSQPFEYDFYVLDYYSEYLKDGAVIIIPISYFDWYYNYEKIFMGDISVYNERYYSILDKDHIMNYEFQKDILYNRIPLLTAGKNIRYIFEDVEMITVYQNQNESVVTDIEYVADWKYKSWVNDVMVLEEPECTKVKQRNVTYLKKTIDYCYENGYIPALVTLPVTNELTNRFSDEFYGDFEENCEEILADYPELQYFNYSKEQEIAGNLELFYDSDHLNSIGANMFSRKLFQDLKVAGIIL